MKDIKLILFDLDDTLVHFDDYWEEGMKETFRRHPLTYSIDPDRLFNVFREKDHIYEEKYHQQKITIEQYRNYRIIETLAEFNKVADEPMANDLMEVYGRVSKTFMKANQDVIDFLILLKSKYLLGIVTNGTTHWQHDKIEAIGLQSIFPKETIFISEEVGCEKPSSKIYEQALEYFQVKPGHTLFVGDSWKNDVEGPSRLGIQSIWLNKKGMTTPDSSKPVAIIEDVLELRAWM